MKFRIVAGGIHIESSNFTPYISDAKDFNVREGEALMERYPWHRDFPDVELIPLIHARALPGGVVSRPFYDAWLKRFLELLSREQAKAPIDGVFFDIHGAMSAQETDDAEGDLLEQIREAVGPDVVISTSMDLHGNISDKLFEASDLLTCYRTAPHIDTAETRLRAFENLVEVLRESRDDLVVAKVDVPILLPGEKTSTEVEPGRSLYKEIESVVEDKDLMDASIWMGFPWADQDRCHGSVVVSGKDRAKVEKAAMHLGRQFWDYRENFEFVGPTTSPEEAIAMALSATSKPYFVSDTGDNPGAGGADDMVVFLKAFLKAYEAEKKDPAARKKVLFASIKDEETVALAYEGKAGDEEVFALGGKIDPGFGGPLKEQFRIKNFYEDGPSGQGVILSRGNLDVIVTSKRHQFSSKTYFENAGVEAFDDYDIIVVKMGYLEPDLSQAQKGWVMALTPGAVDQNLTELPYLKRRKPLYPFEGTDFDPQLSVQTKTYK
jgi:microcystin degradation protein MlrC